MESDKWETIRRLRYGALVKLFRHRWGYVLPDDDAGRGDLWELVTNVSLAPVASDKKVRSIIETWAPWMRSKEADELVEHVGRLTNYELAPTAQQLGQRLRLTNEERQRLKLWPFKPIDATDAELASQSRMRRNARRKAQRARTRVQYLSSCLTATKPWKAEGISRRTWERRRVAGPGQTIVSRAETILATASVEERQRGCARAHCKEPSGKGRVVMLSATMKAKEEERIASGSSRLCHNLRQEQMGVVYAMLARDLAETDPRMAWVTAAHFVGAFVHLDAQAA
jgi:hypothetical protein